LQENRAIKTWHIVEKGRRHRKAMVCTRYGTPETLELQELEKPRPKAKEISIKVLASTVTAGDCEMRSFTFPPYLRLPMRLLFGARKPRMKVL
ncbi:hypothetical protein R0K19_22985, partial [Bacillus sp. SIMBA_161]